MGDAQMASTYFTAQHMMGVPMDPAYAYGKPADTGVEKQKFKTEMCKNWIESGRCRYGSKCQFAHGYHELVGKAPQNNRYKSKLCSTFQTQFYCPYGKRCLFRHEDRALGQVVKFHYKLHTDVFPH